MAGLNLPKCRKIVRAAFARGKEIEANPLSVAVLDAGGNLLAFERQDGASPGRFQIADGKANAAIAMGVPSSKMAELAESMPLFVNSVNSAHQGRFIPVAGGVLATDKKGGIVGAVGVSGDTADSDVACATAGIKAAGFVFVA